VGCPEPDTDTEQSIRGTQWASLMNDAERNSLFDRSLIFHLATTF